MITTRELGDIGEQKAVDLLQSAGCTILCRNYTVRGGEIDIICDDGGTLVFCEVRSRGRGSYASPLETITPQKRRHICRAALRYVTDNGLHDAPIRFDVVAYQSDTGKLTHIKYAFEYTE